MDERAPGQYNNEYQVKKEKVLLSQVEIEKKTISYYQISYQWKKMFLSKNYWMRLSYSVRPTYKGT